MIHANEIRVGNWVEVQNQFVEVITIEEDRIETSAYFHNGMGCNGSYYKDATPITLTPKILDKCGFENIDINKWNKSHYYIIQQKDNTYSLASLVAGYSSVHNVDLKYLHQLQNLYFALTGEELQINNL